MSDPVDYSALLGLEHVFLEDSYIVGIHELPEALRVVLHVVLLPEHPAYEAPRPDRQHCYRTGILEFPKAEVSWEERLFQKFTDRDGLVDYGNIDRLVRHEDGTYEMEGDFGKARIRSNHPELTVRAYKRKAHDHDDEDGHHAHAKNGPHGPH